MSPTSIRKKNMTDDERTKVIASVLARSVNGIPRRGAFVEVAREFPFTVIAVSRVWRRAFDNAMTTGSYISIAPMKGRCGRPKTDRSAELARLRTVPMTQRTTIRSSAAACGLPPTTLYWRVQDGLLRPTISVTKPLRTDDNKEKRLRFCLGHVDRSSRLFNDMYDVVHVDEKFFYVTEVKKRFYLLPGAAPSPEEQAEHHKVMFLAAVARPRRDAATNSFFGGLLGIWPFVERRPAQRSSRNRPAGTMKTHNTSATTDTYRATLVCKLLPAICARMPLPPRNSTIKVQQDNAPPHIQPTDPQFCQAVIDTGRDVVLYFQPPNSPDLNCCDLGLFTAIQARQRQRQSRTMDKLIAATEAAYWELRSSTVNAAFLSLQCAMSSCIQAGGSNDYKLAHMSKAKLQREG